MNTNHEFESLWEQSREYEPFGAPNSFGFETRLRAAISSAVPSGLEEIGRFSWRFTFASMPVLVFAAVFLGLQNPGFFPEGLGGVVSQWSALLPLDLL